MKYRSFHNWLMISMLLIVSLACSLGSLGFGETDQFADSDKPADGEANQIEATSDDMGIRKRVVEEVIEAISPDSKVLSPRNIDQVVEISRFGIGEIKDISWSPDGERLAVASSMGVFIYESPSLLEVAYYETDFNQVNRIAFSSYGQILAIGTRDGFVDLLIVDTWEELYRFPDYVSSSNLAFSPDGRILAFGGRDDSVKLWDVTTGNELNSLEGHEKKVISVAFSPDGALLASGGDDETVRIWDLRNGIELTSLISHVQQYQYSMPVRSIDFSPDGSRLVSGSGDYNDPIKLWHVDRGEELYRFSGHRTEANTSVSFSPEGSLIATGGDDRYIMLWDVESGKELGKLEGHRSRLIKVAFSPAGNILASASEDQTVRLWDMDRLVALNSLESHNGTPQVVFSSDGCMLVSASYDGPLMLRDICKGGELHILEEYEKDVVSAAFSPDGRMLATARRSRSNFNQSTINVWNVDSGEKLTSFLAQGKLGSVSFTPDSGTLAVWTDDNKIIRLWEIANETEQTIIPEDGMVGVYVAFTPDGNLVTLVGEDTVIYFWMPISGEKIKIFDLHDLDMIYGLSFSENFTMLALSGVRGDNAIIWILDLNSGEEILRITRQISYDPHRFFGGLAFSPDEKMLLSAWGNEIIFWDLNDASELHRFDTKQLGGVRVAFSPDGQKFTTGCNNGIIKIWGLP
jgi:WD40 repeat protein